MVLSTFQFRVLKLLYLIALANPLIPYQITVARWGHFALFLTSVGKQVSIKMLAEDTFYQFFFFKLRMCAEFCHCPFCVYEDDQDFFLRC